MMSGESKVRPRELLYFFKMTSRRSSTRSSSVTATSVGEELGRLTHILRLTMSRWMEGRPPEK